MLTRVHRLVFLLDLRNNAFIGIDLKISNASGHTDLKKDAPESDRVNYHRPQQNMDR
jgi:hypothetical protein